MTIAYIKGFQQDDQGVVFFICVLLTILGIVGIALYYWLASKDKRRITQLILFNFPNYHKDYHDLLFKAYKEVREKEIGRVEGENEVLLIKSVFNKKMSDYEKLIKDSLR